MRHQSKNNMTIYKKINEYIKEGVITPYEDSLLNYLSTHTDESNDKIKSNYLDALNSTYSISNCYIFARYLALAINKPFHLYEGKLTSLYEGEFPHAWIETEDSIYDVSFIGKWPKKIYYKLFQPKIENDVDLETDKKFNYYKCNNIETQKSSKLSVLKYIDWYGYMINASIPNPLGIPFYPSWNYFPRDLNKVDWLEFLDFIYDEWNKKNINYRDDIPQELLSKELSQYIDTRNFIKSKKDLYSELIDFIAKNMELYEEKKNVLQDLSLWKVAIKDNYSGSLCELISNIPNIINQITEEEMLQKAPKL